VSKELQDAELALAARELQLRARENDERFIRQAEEAWLCALIETRDCDGRTPLMLAAWHGARGAMNALLERGASLDAVDPHGTTAAQYLREFGKGYYVQEVRLSVARAKMHETITRETAAAPATTPSSPCGGKPPREIL